jgi:2-oxoglutarate/2-oxoacid ferredoxin oxidoreductase subunit alpha
MARPSPIRELDQVTLRFAGDSGDGAQLIGQLFAEDAALAGNDLATLPNYPAEIRAPGGSLPGVSGFQICFSRKDVYTPGDQPDVLVAMNPAALKVCLPEMAAGGAVIVNADAFDELGLHKAGYASDPRRDGSLRDFQTFEVPMTALTLKAVEAMGLPRKQAERPRNFFALGLVLWLYDRPLDAIIDFVRRKFGTNESVARANELALRAGWDYGAGTESFAVRSAVPAANLPPGEYRNVNGNQALALGLVTAGRIAGLTVFYGHYPITPASSIMEELAPLKAYDVRTFQAEDEMAAVGAAIGASWGGAIGATGTSGPGLALKMESISLAVAAELPLVVIDVQRAGPSTGMPTKVEQGDLLMALAGRHGESPVPVLAALTPADCFDAAIEAVRIAVKYMTPVILLSDAYLAGSSEPWRIPDVASLPKIDIKFASAPAGTKGGEVPFNPYARDPITLARPWAPAGTPGLEHRIGGLEKADVTGVVSYDPENHERMTLLRAEKVARIAADIPEIVIEGNKTGDLLVLGWGSTAGAIRAACERLRGNGHKVSCACLRYINPMPRNLGGALKKFKKVLVPELDLGQLCLLIRARYLVDAIPFGKVKGRPFLISEIERKCLETLGTK